MALYFVPNGVMPTAAAQVAQLTGTAIKTMLQVTATNPITIVEWGISFAGSAAATPIAVELLDTGTVAATLTAHVDAGVMKYQGGADVPVASVAGMTYTTTGTGYWSTGGPTEGSIAAVKQFDVQYIAPTNQYVKQFPLGREPLVIAGNIGRIRVTAPATVLCYCYMIISL